MGFFASFAIFEDSRLRVQRRIFRRRPGSPKTPPRTHIPVKKIVVFCALERGCALGQPPRGGLAPRARIWRNLQGIVASGAREWRNLQGSLRRRRECGVVYKGSWPRGCECGVHCEGSWPRGPRAHRQIFKKWRRCQKAPPEHISQYILLLFFCSGEGVAPLGSHREGESWLRRHEYM